MEVIITLYDATICSSNNMKMLPRIGETMEVIGSRYKVKDVIWHIIESTMYVEVKVEWH